jgi:hypothetical protein
MGWRRLYPPPLLSDTANSLRLEGGSAGNDYRAADRWLRRRLR